jgi:dipeptidyl aminopeptidase/acylaminoacyl peptidase
LFLVLLLAAPAWAQGTKSDYERANHFRQLVANKVFKARVTPHWFAGSTRFWYRNDLRGGAREFIDVDAARGVREPAFDHAKLAAALSQATGKPFAADRLPLDNIEFAEGEDSVRFAAEGKGWKFDRHSGALVEGPVPAAPPATPNLPLPGQRGRRGPGPRGESPDGHWRAFIRDRNVFVCDVAKGEEFALTSDGQPGDAYEERFYWSPDSKRLVTLRTKPGSEHRVTFVESSPRDQLQPRVHSIPYRKPGDEVDHPRPHLFDLEARKEIPVPDDLFPNPYELTDFRWEPDSHRFTFLYNQRGHQVLRLIAVDASTGEARPIVDEQSRTFIDYSGKQFVHYLPATGELIWMSERDGWNHLYLYDSRSGTVKNQITRGEWVVRGVDRVDEERRQVWFRAGGIVPGQDPYYVHSCRVNFDGSGRVDLTPDDGTHTVEFSPDRHYLLDTWSRVDLPPVTELRRADDGNSLCELERADLSELLATGWKAPERFVAKGRDGQTDIYGVIYRPTNFNPAKRYPVLEEIYAGPQDSSVPKAFAPVYNGQSMAELGFIVVKIDGMGTSNRSKAFHDVCWKNLGDAGFPDRILWIQAAAHRYPQLDLARVGIYGNSAGGQNALGGLLTHPEFYKVGVAACGCHDNRMDKIWWNEQWMGWPVGPHYEAQSNVTLAPRLQGKLLLIVGEMDTNVDPASTMQVVNALIKADKDFDLLVVPGAGHGLGGPYGLRREQDFFVRHLLGVEPRWEPVGRN